MRQAAAISREIAFPALAWYPQQADWVSQPLTSDSAAYNYPLSLRIAGPLDPDSLRRSLREIVLRHEILRSVFCLDQGTVRQMVLPAPRLRLDEIDLAETDAEPESRLSRALSLASQAANCVFDMREETLFRAILIRLASNDHILALLTHHMVCDDWSAAILLRELSVLYSAFSASGEAAQLDRLPLTYSRWAKSVAPRLSGPEGAAEVQFWREQLGGSHGFHHLEPDFPRRLDHRVRSGAREIRMFPRPVWTALEELGRTARASPFMILLAALNCLLARESQSNDIGLATCVANRTGTQLESMVAPLSNRVVLRTDLSGHPTFREILGRVREVALKAYSHQDVPFGLVVEELSPKQQPGRNPLFQTLVVFLDDRQDRWTFGSATATWLPLDTGTTRYDLNVWLRLKPGESLEADFQYDAGLFERSKVRQLARDYVDLLQVLVADPGGRLPAPSGSKRAARTTESIAAARSPVPSQEEKEIESRLIEMWREILGRTAIGGATDFFEAGGDSLGVARLFSRVERELGVKLPLSAIIESPTCTSLAHRLCSGAPAKTRSSIVAVRPSGSEPPLFCVHNHTGDVLFCRNFSKYVPPDHPVFGLQSRALLGCAPHFSVEEMAESYVEDIEQAHPTGPCPLFGYSFGGLVAFEMAQLLLARGRQVPFLGMFNTPAPGALAGWPIRQFAYVRGRARNELDKLPQLGASQKLVHLARKTADLQRLMLRSAVGDAWRVVWKFWGNETMKRTGRALLPLDQINIGAAKAYAPTNIFPGKILFFQAEEVPYLYAIPPEPGWSPFTTGGLEIVNVSADPAEPVGDQFAKAVAEHFRRSLEQAK